MPGGHLERQASASSEVNKLAVLGSRDSGKAWLINGILGNKNQLMQTASLYEKTICIDKKKNANLHVMDTSDLDQYPAMKRVTIANASVFILLFNIDDRKSFDEVKSLHSEIVEIKQCPPCDISLIVVGSKPENALKQAVPPEEIEDFVISKWGRRYVEISMTSDAGVEHVLRAIRDGMTKEANAPSKDPARKISLLGRLKAVF